MRLTLFLSVALLALGVTGKGWRVAYEKMFLWYAYQIDQLNLEDQQTIGVRCAKWDKPKNACADVDPKYEPCKVVKTTGYDKVTKTPIKTTWPCQTVTEFLSHIDAKSLSPGRFRISGGPANPTPDIEDAATQLHKEKWDDTRYHPWRVLKDGGESFNVMIERVGDIIVKTKASLPAAEYERHKLLFDRATEGLNLIGYYRRVDHMRYLGPALKAKIPGITVEAPVVPGKKAYDVKTKSDTIDFLDFNREETIRKSVGTIPDIEARMDEFYKEYYSTDKDAKDHQIVMESFEGIKNRISGTSCSLR